MEIFRTIIESFSYSRTSYCYLKPLSLFQFGKLATYKSVTTGNLELS